MSNDLLTWLIGNGDVLVMLVRMMFFVFSLQFITGICWILRGAGSLSSH